MAKLTDLKKYDAPNPDDVNDWVFAGKYNVTLVPY